jgi:hypothetical protein|tara:strand:- start:587 stop:1114 length:528 start_codon:yes stop_codon:yes gene_type:complete
MLGHWANLLNTDCIVVDIGPHTVYPIFRVGSSSLMSVADKMYTNKQIHTCEHIDIMIRDPGDRFVSGLNVYCQQNNLDVKETWRLVDQGKLVNRHFAPQYLWLLHLYKFYKGTVTLKPFDNIKKITNVHKKKDKSKKVAVTLLKSFVEVDYRLMDHYNETIQLGELIREYRHALS